MQPIISFNLFESDKSAKKIKRLKKQRDNARKAEQKASSAFEAQARTISALNKQCELLRESDGKRGVALAEQTQRIKDLVDELGIAKEYPKVFGCRDGESLVQYNWSVFVARHRLPYGTVAPATMTAHTTEAEARKALDASYQATKPGYDIADLQWQQPSGPAAAAIVGINLDTGEPVLHSGPASTPGDTQAETSHTPSAQADNEPAGALADADSPIAEAMPTLSVDDQKKEVFDRGDWVLHDNAVDRPLYVARHQRVVVVYAFGDNPVEEVARNVTWRSVKEFKKA